MHARMQVGMRACVIGREVQSISCMYELHACLDEVGGTVCMHACTHVGREEPAQKDR